MILEYLLKLFVLGTPQGTLDNLKLSTLDSIEHVSLGHNTGAMQPIPNARMGR